MTFPRHPHVLTTLGVMMTLILVASTITGTGHSSYCLLSERTMEPLRGADPSYPKWTPVNCGALNSPSGSIGGGQCANDPTNVGKACYDCDLDAQSDLLDYSKKSQWQYYQTTTLSCGNQTKGTCGTTDCENTKPTGSTCSHVLPINNQQSGPGG